MKKIIVRDWTTHSIFLRSRFSKMRACFRKPKKHVVVFSRVKHKATPVIVDPTTTEPIAIQIPPQSIPVVKPTLAKSRRRMRFPSISFPQLPPILVKTIANAVIVATMVILGVLLAPEIYYRVVPTESKPIESSQSGSPLGGNFGDGAWLRDRLSLKSAPSINDIFGGNQDQTTQNTQDNQETAEEPVVIEKPTRYLPEQDASLPEGDWISIPRIGVRTEFQSTGDPEEAMQTGVWKAPDYGLPGQLNMPIIMAAHRFGWDWWWQSDYWRYHSFYLLPDTEPGDRVEIISDQRKWVYEIYSGEEGTDITDYDADMILYTCKFLTSPIRHFRYARLIDEDADTQATQTSLVGDQAAASSE